MKKYLTLIIISISFVLAQVSSISNTRLQSLVLPGWGEQTLGESQRAQNFFIREAAIWLIYIGGKKTSDWYESDYKAFAELHADVNMGGKNYLFAVNMGHYKSMEAYNNTKERQRLPENKYDENKGFEWQWDNSVNRIKFDEMRIKSVTYNKFATFAAGGFILHRLISFIDVIYLERTNLQVNIEPKITQNWSSIQFNFTLEQ